MKSKYLLVGLIFLYVLNGTKEVLGKEILSKSNFRINLKGAYTNLLASSKTSTKENYWDDLNRLRLNFGIDITKTLKAKIIYDIENRIGNFTKTNDFQLLKNRPSNTYLDLNQNVIDKEHFFLKHSLYRAYLSYTNSLFILHIGRQRIPWGVTRVWSPLDYFNPVDPIVIEKTERVGVDAINVEIPIGILSEIDFVYSLYDDFDSSSIMASRIKTNLKQYDLSIIFGKFKKDKIIGSGISGNLFKGGFRGEWTYTFAQSENDYYEIVLSGDYTFQNSFFILIEYYFNDQGKDDEDDYQWDKLVNGDILNLSRNYLYLGIGYDLTPLIRIENNSVYNIDDHSASIEPLFKYSFLANMEWVVGINFFVGKKQIEYKSSYGIPLRKQSEYGDKSNVYWTQLQYYF
ncbi:MAG: hypothetical protein QME42_06885 [bacterium]|nr:hypothetical protein [bacterium]